MGSSAVPLAVDYWDRQDRHVSESVKADPANPASADWDFTLDYRAVAFGICLVATVYRENTIALIGSGGHGIDFVIVDQPVDSPTIVFRASDFEEPMTHETAICKFLGRFRNMTIRDRVLALLKEWRLVESGFAL